MPAPTKVQLIGGHFQDAEGNVLALGHLVMELVQDEQLSSSTGQVCGGIKILINLDANGSVSTSPAQSVWSPENMTPIGASYTVWGYTAQGELAWGPNYNLDVPVGATFDVDNWIPNSTGAGSGGSGGSNLQLQVNGTNNVVQSLLNLESLDGSITITDEGNGSVNFQGGGGLTSTDWHKVSFATLNNAGNGVVPGIGLVMKAATNSTSGSGSIDMQRPFGTNPVSVFMGGGPLSAWGESFGYEGDIVLQGSFEAGAKDSGNINLSILSKWECNASVAPRFMPAWTANTRVPPGTVVTDGAGNYFLQQTATNAVITGTTVPTWNTTVNTVTTDNAGGGTATWLCVGTHRPVLTQDTLLGITDSVNSGLSGGSQQNFMHMDGTGASGGTPYNFIGFRYCPEPIGNAAGGTSGQTGDVHWMAYAGGQNMTPIVVDTGVTPDNNGLNHVFTIKQTSANVITYFIDGAQVAQITISGLTNNFWSVLYHSSYIAGTTGHLDPTSSFTTTWYPATRYGLGALLRQNTIFCAVVAGVSGTPNDAVPYNPGVDGNLYPDGTVEWLAIGSNTNAVSGAMCVSYVFWETAQA